MLPAPDAFRGTARFHLVRVLGQGGMGVVYEAIDRERNGRVALKTIRTLTADNLLRFKNEFRALQDLQHGNLVRLDELFEADGTWFFTMELIEGTDLLRYVRPGLDGEMVVVPATAILGTTGPTVDAGAAMAVGSAEPTSVLGAIAGEVTQPTGPTVMTALLDEDRLRRALPQLVRGLSALHAAGKIHRDVKPANVRVTHDGRVVLLDFGLVTDAFPRELEGRAVGTVTYMAPEQVSDEVIGPAADFYSVGVTLYVALTGRPPFIGDPVEVASLKRLVDPVPPSKIARGVPPDLDALCTALLARDPAQRPDGVEILRRLGAAAAVPARRERPFVGRARELAVLRDAFADVVAGGSAAVLIHGESGVGKSALGLHFLGSVAGPSTTVLAGRCYERESVPYKALDQVVDALGRALAAMPQDDVAALLPERIGLVAQVFPALRKVPAIEAAGVDARTADPFHNRAAVFDAMRELWIRLGRRRPLVIGIDDLQWADLDSLGLLARVFEPPAPPLLLCATVRTAATGAHGVDSLRDHLGYDVRDLHLERLPVDEARALAGALLARAGADDVRIDAIATEAGGHPMFIEALVHHRPASDGDVAEPVPTRLDDVLLARAAALDPAAAQVLELVCLAGGPISQDVCAHAAGLPYDEMTGILSILRSAHLVRTHGPRRGDAVEAYHDRVREAIAARGDTATDTDARRHQHLRLANALEASRTADPEALTMHFARAGETDRAARYAAQAADRAAGALAFDQAARLYRMALALDTGAEPRLRTALAVALANAGRGREAGEAYLAAAEAAGGEQNELRRHAAEQLLISGCIDEGLAVLRTVLVAQGLDVAATPRRALASLLLHRAQVRMRRDLFTPRLRDPATIAPEALARIDTCYAAAMGLATVDTIRGADFQSRHILLALDAGEPYRVACALAAEASFSAAQGGRRRKRTERLLAAAEELARRVAHPNALGFATFAAGSAEYLLGRWANGLELCDRAARIFRDRCTGVAWWSDTIQYFGLECLAYGGQLGELARRVPILLADAEARGNLYATTSLRVGIPNLAWLVADDVDGARGHVADAMARWSTSGFHVQHLAEVLALVQADLYAIDGAAAYRLISAAWPAISGAILSRVQLTQIMTLHQRARAALAFAAEQTGSARRRLVADARRCAHRIVRERMPWSDPFAALARAAADHLGGDDDAAIRELGDAIRGFDATDMHAYAAAARVRLGELEGGDAGSARVAEATALLAAQSVRRPERLVAMLAPGF
jgi:eukaryotic-like serine/threonine-protein kinase